MKDIIITTQTGMLLDAKLIRESNPRLAICQDRVCELNEENTVIESIDLLDLFNN